jgi:hypothetical protein
VKGLAPLDLAEFRQGADKRRVRNPMRPAPKRTRELRLVLLGTFRRNDNELREPLTDEGVEIVAGQNPSEPDAGLR